MIHPGSILLAQPFMEDPHFKHGVVLICEERPDGSVGFIINKKLDIELNDLMSSFPEFDVDVYYGGPVATDTLHFIHNAGDLIEDSIEISKGVFWGGSFEQLKFLVKQQLITEDNVRFFIGYSGWSEGQLAEELDAGSWIVDEMDSNYAFNLKGNLWKKILDNKGGHYSVISRISWDNRNN